MDIKLEQRGAVQLLTPVGRLDTDSSSDIELAIQDLLAVDARHFILDLSQVGYVSSAGLRVLLQLAKELDGGKGSMRLAGLNPQVKQVFDIAGFSKMFAIYPSVDAAFDKHPQAEQQGPALGNLAAKLMGMGAEKRKAGAGDGGSAVASAAAGLLGAKAGAKTAAPKAEVPKAEPRAPAPTPPPPRPAPARAAPVAAPAKKPGFFARLFGKK